MIDDNRPFPIQRTFSKEHLKYLPVCTIPWWLAEIAYREYQSRFKTSQSLEQLAERGGFGRFELLDLLGNQTETNNDKEAFEELRNSQ